MALGALALSLAGCSSLGGATPAARAAPNLGGIDMATALFAVDLPMSVESIDGPTIAYGTALEITLERAEAERVMNVLPAPAEGRSYAIFAIAAADQAEVRAAQATATSGPAAALVVTPRLCATADTLKDRDTVTVLALVSAKRPITLVGPETIAELEARTATPLPACAGHSG